MDSYAGHIVYADLTTGKVRIEPTSTDLKRDYMCGRGFGIRLLSDMVDPKSDPFGSGNILVFAAGPLTGTGVPLGSRYEVSTLSPLTGTATSANSGGVFGWKMKSAGFDAIVITGKSTKPVYVFLDNGKAEIRDAGHLWGKTVPETTDAIVTELNDPQIRVACIGPAGERLVRFACIMNEKTRAAGRGGCGAVMGSKNLKAIAARGNQKIGVADEKKVAEIKVQIKKKIADNGIAKGLHTYGTSVLVNIVNESYVHPTRNFQSAHFPTAEKISGEEFTKNFLKRPKGCFACTIQCGRAHELDGVEGEGPEYESAWAFGSDCGIDDLTAITRANNLCNDYGLDTISAGATIACLMEMTQRGYVQDPIRFGDVNGMVEMVKKIALREGMGNELAEGSYRFADKYGHPELSMSVKSQELPAYDPRGIQGHGLAYATAVRGGDHVYAYLIAPEVLGSPEKLDPFVTAGKAAWVKIFQDLTAAIDASGMCLFTSFALNADDYASLISASTGISCDAADLLKVGERIWNLQKLYNIQAGFGRDDDTLPKRLLNEPLQEGAPKGMVWQREAMLDEYYTLRGWDKEGTPTDAKKRELGLF
ncbi:MAG: aldehyde ferredoxin oxidoreductase family protein [Methanomicrobiales archaeon]